MNKKGLTLVETIITLAIGTIIGGLLLVIMVNTGGLFYKQAPKVEQGLSLNDALGEIQKNIRQAQSIATTSQANKLVLKVPSADSAGNIITNTFDDFIFLLDQKKLVFQVLPNAASSRGSVNQIFSTNVESLVFEYFDNQIPPQQVSPAQATKVKTTLVLKQKSGVSFEQNIATGEANLRND